MTFADATCLNKTLLVKQKYNRKDKSSFKLRFSLSILNKLTFSCIILLNMHVCLIKLTSLSQKTFFFFAAAMRKTTSVKHEFLKAVFLPVACAVMIPLQQVKYHSHLRLISWATNTDILTDDAFALDSLNFYMLAPIFRVKLVPKNRSLATSEPNTQLWDQWKHIRISSQKPNIQTEN